MNKAILISIQAMWTDYIKSGAKDLEVRKNRPKRVPVKCYIYESKNKQPIRINGGEVRYFGRQQVIGEFVCDKIYELSDLTGRVFQTDGGKELNSLLTVNELSEYGKGKVLYGWHITQLKIYAEPKELWEFNKFLPCEVTKPKCGVGHFDGTNRYCKWCAMDSVVYLPPQSWEYVKELEQ